MPLTPAVEIASANGDASNDLGLSDIRIVDSWGPGISRVPAVGALAAARRLSRTAR